jgi:anaerobic selenocysteine-containing dehydrogenase
MKEDVWITTQCGRCYAACGIRVRRVDGIVVKIEGVPDSTQGSEGGLCSKGTASLQQLYDPNRLNVPLRRTNPEKGIGVDPKWKEITWEEVYAEIIPRMKKILEEDPKKLIVGAAMPPGTPLRIGTALSVLGPFGRFTSGVGLHCGNGAHPVGGLIHGSWSIVPDFKYCNYAIYFGASKGHGSGHSAMAAARMVAEARSRGMKLVVFDPICNFAASKASEWIPIIPGTDAAVVLAMCNIIVNELGTIDEPFLKLKTNAPYLIGPDLKYVRENGPARGVKGHKRLSDEELTFIGDDDTNKPLVWDAGEGKAKVYDDPTIQDYALEGDYEVNGIKYRPAFQMLKEHLKSYTPEMASEASTVPAETIRRIATEFAHEARIGSTISIDGHSLPLRPVGAVIFRGGQGHENSYHSCFAVNLLSEIVGAVEVPGGTTGWPARTLGYPGREDVDPGALKWSVFKGLDGFLQNERFGPFCGQSNKNMPFHGEWPIPLPSLKHDPMLMDIQPIGLFKYVAGGSDRDEVWKKLGADYNPEMFIGGGNMAISVGNWDSMAQALKAIPFFVSLEVFNSETTEGFADIVLPDTCYLEEDNWAKGLAQNFNHSWGMDDWCYHVTQQVVEPIAERKNNYDIGLEILDRLGKEWGRDLIAETNARFNKVLPINEENQLKPTDRPTIREVGDRVVKSTFGSEHDWGWFKKHGFIRWPKQLDEAYWIWFLDLRIPIYMEYLVHMREEVEKINQETGLSIDLEQYTPLISWFPCTNHKVKDPKYDLYCYSYRDTLHSASSTMEQPWLDEASRMNPYTYNITMNVETGKEKGIKDGDGIEVETYQGRKAEGTVKLMEGQHPQTIGIAATSGHYAKGQPIALGKGTNFDTLLPMDFEHMDPICGNIETAVRVRVSKL